MGDMPAFGMHLIFEVDSNSKFNLKNKCYGRTFGQVRGKKWVINYSMVNTILGIGEDRGVRGPSIDHAKFIA